MSVTQSISISQKETWSYFKNIFYYHYPHFRQLYQYKMHTSMCCHGKYFAVMDTFLTPHYNQSIKPHIWHTHTTYIVIENALAVNTFIHHLSHVTLNVQQNNPIFGLGIIKNTCKSKNRIWHHCVLCLSLKITEITFQELFPFIYVNL